MRCVRLPSGAIGFSARSSPAFDLTPVSKGEVAVASLHSGCPFHLQHPATFQKSQFGIALTRSWQTAIIHQPFIGSIEGILPSALRHAGRSCQAPLGGKCGRVRSLRRSMNSRRARSMISKKKPSRRCGCRSGKYCLVVAVTEMLAARSASEKFGLQSEAGFEIRRNSCARSAGPGNRDR